MAYIKVRNTSMVAQGWGLLCLPTKECTNPPLGYPFGQMIKLSGSIDSQLSIDVTDVSHADITDLTQRFTVLNPEVDKRMMLGLSTNHISASVRLYKYEYRLGPSGEKRRWITLPRGSTLSTIRMLKGRGYELEIQKNVTSFDVFKPTVSDLGVDLRDYQEDAVNKMIDRVQGFISLPCGAGKTVIGSSAIVLANQPTIVLVHTEDLCKQWEEAFSNLHFLQPRVVGSSKNPHFKWKPLGPGEVAICMVQTLHANQHLRGPLLQSAGAVLLDECHHAPANSFRTLFDEIPARFRWGLTATPERSDGWTGLLPMFIGPKLYAKSMEELVSAGYLMQPKIFAIDSGFAPPPLNTKGNTHKSATKAVSWVCNNVERTEMVVQLAAMASDNERVVLLLVPRVALASKIAQRLREIGHSAKAITGRVSKEGRAHTLNQIRSGVLNILCATQLADEGLDVPNIDFLINASGGRTSGRAIQRIGRAMRVSKDKPTPIVVEVVDGGGMFRSQWKARSLAYRSHLNCQPSALMKIEQIRHVLDREFNDII